MKELRKVGWSGAKFSIVAEYESAKEMWKAEEELIQEHSQNPNCLNSMPHDIRNDVENVRDAKTTRRKLIVKNVNIVRT